MIPASTLSGDVSAPLIRSTSGRPSFGSVAANMSRGPGVPAEDRATLVPLFSGQGAASRCWEAAAAEGEPRAPCVRAGRCRERCVRPRCPAAPRRLTPRRPGSPACAALASCSTWHAQPASCAAQPAGKAGRDGPGGARVPPETASRVDADGSDCAGPRGGNGTSGESLRVRLITRARRSSYRAGGASVAGGSSVHSVLPEPGRRQCTAFVLFAQRAGRLRQPPPQRRRMASVGPCSGRRPKSGRG